MPSCIQLYILSLESVQCAALRSGSPQEVSDNGVGIETFSLSEEERRELYQKASDCINSAEFDGKRLSHCVLCWRPYENPKFKDPKNKNPPRSHLIPEAILKRHVKWVKFQEREASFLTEAMKQKLSNLAGVYHEAKERKVNPTKLKYPLLCHPCEQRLGIWENTFVSVLYDHFQAYFTKETSTLSGWDGSGIEITQEASFHIEHFALSFLWRELMVSSGWFEAIEKFREKLVDPDKRTRWIKVECVDPRVMQDLQRTSEDFLLHEVICTRYSALAFPKEPDAPDTVDGSRILGWLGPLSFRILDKCEDVSPGPYTISSEPTQNTLDKFADFARLPGGKKVIDALFLNLKLPIAACTPPSIALAEGVGFNQADNRFSLPSHYRNIVRLQYVAEGMDCFVTYGETTNTATKTLARCFFVARVEKRNTLATAFEFRQNGELRIHHKLMKTNVASEHQKLVDSLGRKVALICFKCHQCGKESRGKPWEHSCGKCRGSFCCSKTCAREHSNKCPRVFG